MSKIAPAKRRKPEKDRAESVIHIRVKRADKEHWQALAKECGVSLSALILWWMSDC